MKVRSSFAIFLALLVAVFFHPDKLLAGAPAEGQKSSTSVDFGTVGVGSASPATSVVLTFKAAATLRRVAVVSQGIAGTEFSDAGTGSCKAGVQYRAGDRCTVDVTFIPKLGGARYGVVTLEGSNGNVLATGMVQGNGSGAQGKPSPGLASRPSVDAQASGARISATPADASDAASGSSANCSVTSSNSGLISGVCTLQNLAQILSGSQPNVNFGSINVGSSSSATAVTLNFAAAGTLGSVTVLTQGVTGLDFANAGTGNCAVGTNYAVASTCQVNVIFSPRLAGSRYGAVVATDNSGNVLATGYMQGSGTGPQVNFLPGTEIALPTSSLMFPFAVAVDAAGDVYIADSGNNRVLKETFSSGSYTESTVTTSTLSYPTGIAFDAAGNLYIADTGNNRVLKEAFFAGAYTESTVTTSALSSPSGVAVDAAGNLYIADTGNNRILIEALAQGTYTETTLTTSPLNNPTGAAVDANGNIYIADTGNNRVLIETLSSSGTTESTLATSPLTSPSAVTIDGFGNIYIADTWNNRVIEESLSGGNTVESTVTTSALSGPVGVAVAGSGNIYIANTYNNAVLEEDLADPPSLNFASTAPGLTSSDSPQAVMLLDVGNATLTFPVPGSGSNPSIAANFILGSSGATACPVVSAGASASGTLASGQGCMLSVSFTPTQAGAFTGALVLNDNALNASTTQSLALSGVGTGSTQQTIVFVAIPSQQAGTIFPLSATASSGLQVTFTSTTPAVCTVSGTVAMLDITGTCNIVASQAGSPVYAAAAPVTQSFAVTLVPQTITFASIPAQVINSAVPVVLSATASSQYPVTFTSITPTVCSVSNDTSTASLLTAGTCSIQASQAGDGLVFAPAPTVTQSFAVLQLNAPVASGFGSVNIGSSSAPVAVSLTLANAATLGRVSVLTEGANGLDFANTGGGSCATGVNYNGGVSCTVSVTFSPQVSGIRYGAVVLLDGSGHTLATAYLEGTGVGPQVNFLPGIETVVPSSALSSPFAVAVDGSGNVYIADANNNRVLKETLTGAGYTESTVPTSALLFPSGIALDGAGNIYIADAGNNRVLEESPSAGGYTETTVQTSALNYPIAVAVDGGGNVYIVDAGNNRVLVESPIPGGYNETTVPTSELAGPSGVAVDGSGNVYIADTDNNRVIMETLAQGSYTESVLATSQLNNPSGLALDGNGNVFISDTYNNRVLKEQLSSGTDVESIVTTSALLAPAAVAVTGSGNIYVVDTGNNRVLEENLSASPALTFASTAPGSTSSDSPQTITLENIGNAALSFPAPGSGSNPFVPVGFTLGSGAAACPLIGSGSPAGSLSASQGCQLVVSFAPTAPGVFSAPLVVTDTALNAGAPTYASQSIALNGVGTGTTPQTITFGAIPSQTAGTTLALTATASSGLSVSFASATPSVCTVAGSTATLAAAGTCTIVATQAGSPIYAAAPSVTQSLTVNLAAQTISFVAIPTQIINTSAPVTLNATASSELPVSFTSTTPAVCTVSPAASTATLLALGSCTIQASQPGDGVVYAAAPTVTQTFSVVSIGGQAATSFGAVNIGVTSTPVAVMVNFNSGATLGSIGVLTGGASGLDFANTGTGSCEPGTNYAASSTCTVNVTFSPQQPGSRFGAVVLYDGSGNPVATAHFTGTGVGPQAVFASGVETAVSSSALSNPNGIAADAAGNIYIADTSNSRIVKEAFTGGAYTQSTVPTSSLSGPEGVAVDAGGTLYIADTGNNRVLIERLSSVGYLEVELPTSTLDSPSSVAVDGSGNVYIADTDNNRVLIETASAGGFTETQLPTSPLSSPYGLAVDGNGDVFVADSGNNRVLMETYSSGGYTESAITTSPLNNPIAVALDGSGNVYIADNGNNRALLETLSSGTYSETVLSTSPMNAPSGIAVAKGSVFIADTDNDRMLWENLSAPPSLTFALTPPGQTSSDSPQTVVVANIGNASLTFPVPPSGNNPAISGSFSLSSSAPAACQVVNAGASTPATLLAGASCHMPISFAPPASGSYSGSLALIDNSLNVIATQMITLSGSGMGSTQQTISFAAIGPQPVNSTVALSATASSALPVSFASVTPTFCTLTGANVSLIAAGTCTIVASQAGSSVYAVASTVSQSFQVTPLPQTINFPQIAAQIINSSTPFVLSATASSGLPVNFASTTPSICTVNSAAATATLLADGSCTIQATQPGDDVIYAAAPTVAQTFIVESPNPLTATVFPPTAIGSTSPAVTVTLNLKSATTLGNVSMLTDGAIGLDFASTGTGSCTAGASFAASSSCTVNVTFSPRFAGTSNGAVVLSDASGTVVATAYLEGPGRGPQLNFLPGNETTIPTTDVFGLDAIALDGSGNLYIIDNFLSRVVKETPSAGGYTMSVVTSDIGWPAGGGIAVDGAGDVYIADSANNRVLKETGGYIESTVPTSPLSFPTGLAVDGSGNIYVADTSNNRVLEETPTPNGYSESTIPSSPLNEPSGVAVDSNGNVYIADSGNNRILKETYAAGSYTESVLPTLLSGNLSVDANGNLYIFGGNSILKAAPSAGGYTVTTLPTVSPVFPASVAVDLTGSVYIGGSIFNASTNSTNLAVVKEDYADAPSLTFALTPPGQISSDSPKMVTIENIGTSPLNFAVPLSGSNPGITGDFTLSNSGSSLCPQVSAGASSGWSIAGGQSCQLPIGFTAPGAGTFTGGIALFDNSLNTSASQTIQLTGMGSGSTPQTITFAPIVAPVLGANVVTATASSGLPVTLSVATSDNCYLASGSLWIYLPGVCTVQAYQEGNTVYAPATATETITIGLQSQTITFPAILAQIVNTTAALPLQAYASSNLPIAYTTSTPSICTISGTTATLLADGTCTITASQLGDGVFYSPATPVTQSFTIQSASPVSSASFGNVNIGTASSAIAVNVTFSSGGMLGSLTVLTQGVTGLDFTNAGAGSCTVGSSYQAAAHCTVNVVFTPTLAGTRYGAVELADNFGNLLTTAYVQGSGVGPELNFLPSTEITVPSSALANPSGVAVDASGDIYIVDTYNQRVLKETPGPGGFTESTVQTSALSYPYGIAVDGAGSLYIADTGDNRILKETPRTNGYTENTIPSSVLNAPFAVAVDGSGNVYISDTNNNRVLLEALSGGSYTESVIPTSQLSDPYGIAVDGGGNVYIADPYDNRVLKESLSLGTYRESIVPSSAWGSFGLAVDGGGSVYVSNYYAWGLGNSNVLKETYANGSYSESVIQTSQLNGPYAVAVDGGGNVYIADTFDNRVLKEDFADPPALNFSLTAPGTASSDSPRTVVVENVGNSPLSFPALSVGTNPTVPAGFSLNSSVTSACQVIGAGASSPGTLLAGASCLLPISFVPTAANVYGGSLVLTDNALNAPAPAYGTQTIQLNGTGTGSTQQTISFSSILPQPFNTTVALVATASSGLPVSFTSLTPAVCTVSGSIATLNAAGSCTLQAIQQGSTVYAAAAPVTQSFIVNLEPQTITFQPISSQILNTTVPVPLNAAASSGYLVTFNSLTPSVCGVSSFNATLLALGTCTIQANQQGDGVTYAPAPAVTQNFTVESVSPLTAVNFGSVNIGTTSTPVSVTLTFTAASTLGSASVLTQGASNLDFAAAGAGSCALGNNYNAGDACTVGVTFTPVAAGIRSGSVVLADGSGNVLAIAYLEGSGTGPQITLLPGTESTVSSTPPGSGGSANTLSDPAGLAVDGSGNVYIAAYGDNAIIEESPLNGTYTYGVVPTSSLSGPLGVAVDGAGNLYIADTYNYRILKETPTVGAFGSYTESTVQTSALSGPEAVAVDSSGNVYIADTYSRRILMETPSAGSYTESVIPTSQLNWPTGIAADGNGNVYIADFSSFGARVLKETFSGGGYTEITLPTTNLSNPAAVAVDGVGDVYIAQWGPSQPGNGTVLKMTPMAGTYVQTTVPTSPLYQPLGVAVDAHGNVYVGTGTTFGQVLKEDLADGPSLNFALTAPGSTSSDSPQTVTVANIGNAVLTIPSPASGNNPSITASFSLGSNAPLDCSLVSAGATTAGAVFPGQTCLLPISFTAPSAGTITGTLTLTDNSLNAAAPGYATQIVQLTGLGQGSTPQSIFFTPIPNQSLFAVVQLSATATSDLAIVFTSTTPSVCSVSGSIFVSLNTGGTCTIQASQPGSIVYAIAPPVTQSFTVNLLNQTINFGPIAEQVLNPSVPIKLVATASSNLPVSFISTAPLVCAVSGSAATLLADGLCTIQASQPGNSEFTAATPVTQSFTIESANQAAASNVGSVNLGSSGSPVLVALTFNSAATLGSVSVLTNGVSGLDFAAAGAGTCTVGTSYNAGDTCTVAITFTPEFSGTRTGAVVLTDASGNVLATAYIAGTGVGPQIDFLPGTETAVPNSASGPFGVAVDAGGSVYVLDRYNGGVLKETLSAGAYTESTIPTSSLNGPSGIALDAVGNVYIADTSNNRVLEETPAAGSYTETVLPTSALNNPSSIAVDEGGNVYIADTENARVLIEIPSAGGYIESTVPNSATSPSQVAVDGSGDVFILDNGSGRLLLETLKGGSYIESILPLIPQNSVQSLAVDGNGYVYLSIFGFPSNSIAILLQTQGTYAEKTIPTSSLQYPSGIAVDGSGNVYLTDLFRDVVLKEDLADAPTLNFASTEVGSTSTDSPQSVSVENLGNAALSFPVPATGENPSIPANFTYNSLQPFACSILLPGSNSPVTLSAGQLCALPISFAPTAGGTFSAPLVLTDTAHNAAAPGFATQSILLNGTGIQSNLTSQTISFPAISSQAFGGSVTLLATASSGLPVTYTSTTPTVCTVSGATASLVGVGTCTIQADQPGNATYAVASTVTQSFAVNPAAQSITFTALTSPITYSLSPITLSATDTSGLPVTFSIVSGPATVSGSTLTITGAGTVVVAANQAGNANYSAAPQVTQTVVVNTAAQTITFTAPSGTQYVLANATLGATASSGLAVTYSTSTPLVCSLSGNVVSYLTVGTCSVTAAQTGNAGYLAARSVTANIVVHINPQTIAFTQPTSPVTYASGLTIMASATGGASGNPVVFTIDGSSTASATISGNVVTVNSPGVVYIDANQAGNTDYAAAAQVKRGVTVSLIAQTITFTQPTSPVTYASGLTITASATGGGSGNPVVFTIDGSSTASATISGNVVTVNSPGVVYIDANQAGNADYAAAPQVKRGVTVSLIAQTITFPQPTTPVTYASGLTITASATGGASGNPVLFTIDSSSTASATISGNVVTVNSPGVVYIDANQAGNADYAAAAQVKRGVTVSLIAQTITFTQPTSPVTYAAGLTITASATGGGSGNPVVFTIDGSSTASATISGNVVTVNSPGVVYIDANQAGNTDYAAAAQVKRGVTVSLIAQTITFTQPTSPVTYAAGLTITASATGGASGNPVVFTIDGSSTASATISGNVVTVNSPGVVYIDANQAGNTDYAAAPQVKRGVTVNLIAQTITFTQPTSPVTYASGLTITASATGGASGNPVVFTIDGSSTASATISGNVVTVNSPGVVYIDANQAGNTDYAAAAQVKRGVTVSLIAQTITFTQPTSPVTYAAGLTITASATGGASGNPVVFTIDGSSTASATISGNVVTVNSPGVVYIDANQAGNADYAAAAQVKRGVTVSLIAQTIAFTQPTSPVTYAAGLTITLSATASSGLPVTFSVVSGPATISGNTLTITGTGSVVVAANQAGNTDYAAAAQVKRTIVVNGG